MDWSNVTWDTARAGGFVAYLLLTATVCFGIVLSAGVRSEGWPKFLGREVHNHLVLLTLVFTALHTVGIWLDPFVRFTPVEVFVPLTSHYRPVWMALGIVTAYLLVAIYLSERLRPWIGWTWWRRLHFVAFPTWALATLHGLGNGSDSQASWAFALYALAFSAVAALLVLRVARAAWPPGQRATIAAGLLVLAGAGWIWAVEGPLQAGWNSVANNGNGNGSRLVSATAPSPAPRTALALPFESGFSGTASVSGPGSDGLSTLTIDGRLQQAPGGSVRLVLQGRQRSTGFGVVAGQVSFQPASGDPYTGQVQSTRDGRVGAVVQGASGSVTLTVAITGSNGSEVDGVVDGAAR